MAQEETPKSVGQETLKESNSSLASDAKWVITQENDFVAVTNICENRALFLFRLQLYLLK